MSTKEAYKKKAEAELELAQARLAEFKAKAKNFTADTSISYNKEVEELEHGVDAAKTRLSELGEAGEDAWEHLKEGVEHAMKSTTTAIRNIADKFKH